MRAITSLVFSNALIFIVLICLTSSPGQESAEIPSKIVLKNGEIILAQVVYEDSTSVLDKKDGKSVWLQLADIERIDRPARPDSEDEDLSVVTTFGGETIAQIAERYREDAGFIGRLNNLPLDSPLDKGLKIKIPRRSADGVSRPMVQVADVPPNYSGFNPTTVFTVFAGVRNKLTKSKFETTAAYTERAKQALGQLALDSNKTARDVLTFVIWERTEDYDADARLYSVKPVTARAFPLALSNDFAPDGLSLSDGSATEVNLTSSSKKLVLRKVNSCRKILASVFFKHGKETTTHQALN